MNPLDSFTVERLESMASGNLEDLPFLSDFEQRILSDRRELAKIALAAKQAKPVAYLTWHQGFRAPDDCEEYLNAYAHETKEKSCDGSDAIPVFDAPIAPQITDGWIKCSERMPEVDESDHAPVIASEGNNSFIAFFNKHEGKFLDEPFGDSLGNKITHWMLLPAPPEGMDG